MTESFGILVGPHPCTGDRSTCETCKAHHDLIKALVRK